VRALAIVLVAGCGHLDFDPLAAADAPGDTAPGDTALDAHLVAWYQMEMIGSGTTPETVPDSSGNHHDGTCSDAATAYGCPLPVTGRIGGGYEFDGTDQQVVIHSTPQLELPGAFTIAAWVKIENAPATRACAATKGLGPDFYNSWALCIETSQAVFFYTVTGTTESNLFSTATVATGTWHHVALTWDGTTKTIWLDGDSVANEAATAVDFDSSSIYIGGDVDSGAPTALFPGDLDDLRIYDVALGPSEVLALANP